jgi:hypothetical protein
MDVHVRDTQAVSFIQNTWDQRDMFDLRFFFSDFEIFLNMKFIYVSYVPYRHNLKVISYNIFNNCVQETVSLYQIFCLCLKSFGIWSISDFGFFKLEMFNLQCIL